MKRLLAYSVEISCIMLAVFADGQDLHTCPCCGHALPPGYVLVATGAVPPVVTASVPVTVVAAVPEAVLKKTVAPARDWKASLYGGFTKKSGNTTLSSYNYGGEFDKRNGKFYRYRLKTDGRYSETDSRVSESKAELSGEMRRLIGERWFISGRLSALHDDLKDLSYRAKAGPGIGRYLVDSETLTADVSTGLLYVQEKLIGETSGYISWRLSQRLDWQVTKSFKCWTETEFFMGVENVDNYQIAFTSGIENKINDHLSLLVSVQDDYDSLPDQVNKIEKNDLEVRTGLRYHF